LETGGEKQILSRLRASPEELRQPLLVQFIEEQLLEILRWDASRRGELSRGFVAIGLDSLMSVDLQFRLQTALDFALPLGEEFESRSAEALADFLLREYLKLD
jgi:acyl carrier protein